MRIFSLLKNWSTLGEFHSMHDCGGELLCPVVQVTVPVAHHFYGLWLQPSTKNFPLKCAACQNGTVQLDGSNVWNISSLKTCYTVCEL